MKMIWLLTLSMCALPSRMAFAMSEFRSIYENKIGVGLLEDERAREAEAQFLKALALDPFNPILRYNLGVTYLMQKKFDRAEKEFAAVLRIPGVNPEIAFMANFNAAIAAQEMKNIDRALDYYQAALRFRPDSREVRVNIELLTSGQAGQQGGQGQQQGQEPQQDPQGQGQQPQSNPQQNEQDQQQKQPQNFSRDEIEKILEELERQEQKVRALEYGTKGGREKGPGKDW